MGEWKQGDEIAGITIIWRSEMVPVLGGDRMCQGQETVWCELGFSYPQGLKSFFFFLSVEGTQ